MQSLDAEYSPSNRRISFGEARNLFVLYLTFALPAACVYGAAIALIVVTKTYRHLIHRLRLYLAVAGLAHAVTIALELSPVDISRYDNSTVMVKSGWDWACTLIGALAQYCSIFQTLVTAWISFYVLALVAFYEQLKKQRKHEIVGLAVVVFAPLLLTWEPFIGASYGLAGTSCWISDDYGRNTSLGYTLRIAVNLAPVTILTLVSIMLLVVAILLLSRNSGRRNGYLRKQNRKAMKQVLPLMLYPGAYFITYLVYLILILSDASDVTDVTDVIVVSLLQACSVVLLISLLLHEKFLSNCREWLSNLCRRAESQHVILVTTTSVTSAVRNDVQHSENEALVHSV